MKFSKLRINGFKGFADAVELPIEDGLSGIVGPNGCGKSNLVEAIGWLMGENRPTAMRGAAMEDVIFSGSATRPRGAMAEVQLHVDNSARLAPPAFNDNDDLVLTRRIERELGSTFLANGRDVRWRDMQLLFADAASGARSSALVNQGQTNDIINSKPAARKSILEDAAGIGGLYRRRHDAELKLASTEQNLLRINDLLEQLESQLNSLNRQARQAERYRKLGEQLRRIEFIYLYAVWRQAQDQAAEAKTRQLRAATESTRLQSTALRASSRKTQLEEKVDPLRMEAASSESALQRIKAEIKVIESQAAAAEQAVSVLHTQLAELAEDIDRETELRDDAIERISHLENQQSALQTGGSEFKAKHSQTAARLADALDKLTALETELDISNSRVAAIQSSRQTADQAFRTAGQKLEACRQRYLKAASLVSEAEARLAEAVILAKSADGARSDAERAAEQAESVLEELEAKRLLLSEKLTVASKQLSEADSRLAALGSEHNELQKLVKGDASGSTKLLNLVQVERGFEAAFGAAFGDDAFAPVCTENTGTGWHHLEPLEQYPDLPFGTEPLTDHARAPRFLQRRLRQIGIVSREDLDRLQVALHQGQRIVTLNGDLRRWDGFARVAGEEPNRAALRLRQLNRIKELAEEIADAKQKSEEIRDMQRSLQDQFNDVDQASKNARVRRKQTEGSLAKASRSWSAAEAGHNSAERTLLSLKESRARAAIEMQEAKDVYSEAEQHAAKQEDPESVQLVAAGLKKAVAEARANMLEEQAAKSEIERKEAERKHRLAELTAELVNWKAREQQADQRISELVGRRRQREAERPEIESKPQVINARRDALAKEITSVEARCQESADRLNAAVAEAREAARLASEAEKAVSSSLEAKGRADADAAHANESLEQSQANIRDKTNCSPKELAEYLQLETTQLSEPELYEIEINRLRRSRDALGAVNLMAKQDIEVLQAEISEIKTERVDLEQAVGRLRRTISGLNKEGQERLLTAFEAVNEHFKQLFTQLFGGGKARLELVQGDDPLETGLEILCHPPGKRFSSISLLSGGEQSLTAMALIFAFFLSNPAPVCVLDEVDAPLDDSNVMRFCDLMATIMQKTGTRFLVITHNPITMSHMDRLFGITMQERGVSRLVSVDLGEAERLAA